MAKDHIPDINHPAELTVQEHTYLRLRNAIMVGALQPGTALTIRGLAHMLDLSQTPIREAIRRLSSEGAIEVLGNRRLRIPEVTPGRFDELVNLRINLETYAASRALPHVSDVDIEDLRKVDDDMDRHMAGGNLDELTRLNYVFHASLYRLNPDQAALPLIESIWLQLGPFQRQVVQNVDDYYVVDRHKEILHALAGRDAKSLTRAIADDINDGVVKAGRDLLRRAV